MSSIKQDAINALDLAREIAVEKFGAEAVRDIPRLVTDIALLLAQLHGTRTAAVSAAKKKPGM